MKGNFQEFAWGEHRRVEEEVKGGARLLSPNPTMLFALCDELKLAAMLFFSSRSRHRLRKHNTRGATKSANVFRRQPPAAITEQMSAKKPPAPVSAPLRVSLRKKVVRSLERANFTIKSVTPKSAQKNSSAAASEGKREADTTATGDVIDVDDAAMDRVVAEIQRTFPTPTSRRGKFTHPKLRVQGWFSDGHETEEWWEKKGPYKERIRRLAQEATPVAAMPRLEQFSDVLSKLELMMRNLEAGDGPLVPTKVYLRVREPTRLGSYRAVHVLVETEHWTQNAAYTPAFRKFRQIFSKRNEDYVSDPKEATGGDVDEDLDDFYRLSIWSSADTTKGSTLRSTHASRPRSCGDCGRV
jgi:hypothetical protein